MVVVTIRGDSRTVVLLALVIMSDVVVVIFLFLSVLSSIRVISEVVGSFV